MIDPRYKSCHSWSVSLKEEVLEILFKRAIQSPNKLCNISWGSLATYSSISFGHWYEAEKCRKWNDSEEHQLLLNVLRRVILLPLTKTPLESYL